MNQIDLHQRNAIVTGAAQGIGLAVAKRFLASGAEVTLWDQDSTLLRETLRDLNTPSVQGQTVDVTDPMSIEAALADRAHPVDILVCNAGISGPNTTTWQYPLEEWRRVLSIDLDGVFYCCRAIVPRMLEHGYGRIVNMASIAGKEGNPNASAYSAAKAGVIALTKSLAKELADRDIAVNCVTPAAAKTRIFDQMNQEHIDYMLSKIPRGRFVLVDEIAALIAWIASAENSFTTGAVFDLSGGRATY